MINADNKELINGYITWFENNEKTKELYDLLSLQRFNIKNTSQTDVIKLNNYYTFAVLDQDKNSKTGYYTMCINKEFAHRVKAKLEAWQKILK